MARVHLLWGRDGLLTCLENAVHFNHLLHLFMMRSDSNAMHDRDKYAHYRVYSNVQE